MCHSKESTIRLLERGRDEARLCNSVGGGIEFYPSEMMTTGVRIREEKLHCIRIEENHSTPITPARKILALVFNPESGHLSCYIKVSRSIYALGPKRAIMIPGLHEHMKTSPD